MTAYKEKEILKISNIDSCTIINISDISHLTASSNYTFIYHRDQMAIGSKTLKYYLDKLDEGRFIRPHRSFVININFIKSINYSSRKITLKNNREIPLARARKREFRETVDRLKACSI